MGEGYRPHIEITTQIGCPAQCKHCPQDKLMQAYKGNRVLSFTDFKKICDKIPSKVDIHFSGMCEPFINPMAVEMVLYALQNHEVSIFTTLTGLTKDTYNILQRYKYRDFCVHVPDGQLNTKLKATEEYQELLQYVNGCKPNANHYWYSMHGDYHPLILPIIKNEEFENTMIDRAGNIEWFYQHYQHDKNVVCGCSSFDQNVLLPNGDVYLCCMDYGLKHKLGNLLENTYAELNRAAHYELCQKCNRGVIIKQ